MTRLVALTGNIAAGKSTVARRWAAHGVVVVDADADARAAVAPGTPALAAIVQRFGPHVLAADGTLDRAALRRRVFGDGEARTQLEAIVHPEVLRRRDAAVAAARTAGAPLVVCDIPLLFETGRDREFETIVLVDAPDDIRRQRLMRDRGLTAAEAEAMMAAQAPAATKRGRATYVLDNDGPPEALDAKADALLVQLRAGH
jgi:dephospho-CoA kinase